MKSYFSGSINSIDAGGPPKLNHLMEIVSSINSPLGDTIPTLMRCLPPGLLSDYDHSPNNSRLIVKYHYYNGRSSSRSPLSAMENLEGSPALVKVEDNIVVVDGIFVGSATPKTGGKLRSPAATSDFGGNSLDSGGGSLYRTELCLSWEDSGACRYGHKCQFAHGQEELCPVPFYAYESNKTRLITSQPYFCPPSSRFSPGNRIVSGAYKPEHPILMETLQSNKALPMQLKDPSVALPQSTKFAMLLKDTPAPVPEAKSTDWCPLDDSIGATLTSSDESPSRDVVSAYISNILYGRKQKKRFPVFIDICTG